MPPSIRRGDDHPKVEQADEDDYYECGGEHCRAQHSERAKRKRDELKGPEAYRATDDELFARCRLVSSTEDEQDAPANDDAGVDHADDKRGRCEQRGILAHQFRRWHGR